MKIGKIDIKKLNPSLYNPRKDLQPEDSEYQKIKRSIEKFGFVEPLIINKDMSVIGGHQRLKVLKELGYSEIDCVIVDLDKTKEKALNIALNKIEGEWDFPKLKDILQELDTSEFDMDITGFEYTDLEELMTQFHVPEEECEHIKLTDKFIIPPFSVFDARQGYWQDRKRAWLALGIQGELGRGDGATSTMNSVNITKYGRKKQPRTSIFDPVLCEVVYRWFCVKNGHILDPFAGESAKGIVATYLGFNYTGIELREEQIFANRIQADKLKLNPNWIVGDSSKLNKYLPDDYKYDLVFTSPPYYDLEIYSKGEKDGSFFKTYDKFMEWYRDIFKQATDRLKDNRFLVIKVGEIRDKKTGIYRNFVSDNMVCFKELGLHFYNEAIFITPLGSLPVRVGRPFTRWRKLGKTHQNILIFYKGNINKIPKYFQEDIEYADICGTEEN